MLKIAHRGASAYAPENTLTAFRKAIEMGADGIELDVHLCKSGELVVIHDNTVDRTTNGKGLVADMTLAQLKTLQIAGGETIPTLEEVLDVLGPEPYCFIEIKHAQTILSVAELVQKYLAKGWSAQRLYLISFHHDALKVAGAAFPSLTLGVSVEKLSLQAIEQAQTFAARAILPEYHSLTSLMIKEMRRSGLKLFTWTVNEAADIERVRKVGVDGIMSDYPDRLTT